MVNVQVMNEKAKAKQDIIDSIRDLYTLKLKLPLGNPNLKLVHTNQFLFTELPKGVFDLANMDLISKALNDKYSRYSGYTLNRWYIEGITINNDQSHFDMELTLNPFASSFTKYSEDMKNIQKAYTDAFQKTNTQNNTANVKSVTGNIILKDVNGFNKSDNTYIKKVVEDALKENNYPTDEFKRANTLFEYYKKYHYYAGYECMPKMASKGFEGTWKSDNHNCGDGASTICAMFRGNGLTADIMHKYGHFYVRVKCNGEWYYCDQAGGEGQHNWRTLGKGGGNDNVFEGIDSSASVVDFRYC